MQFWIYVTALACSSLAADLPEDVKELTKNHTQFALSLYSTLDKGDANLVFSPYSIATCLSMVWVGARGETESQMQKTLHMGISRKNVAKTAGALNQSLLPAQGGYVLSNANALWVDQGTFLLTDFLYAMEQQFRAKTGKVNFKVADSACQTINDWVSTQTQGKIASLLTPAEIDATTQLVLTTALYFQGSWASPFDAKATQDWPFHPTPDASTSVKMLHQVVTAPYYENELIQMVALPFTGQTAGGGTLGAVIAFPKSADNFEAMVRELPEQFESWLSSLAPTSVDLLLPKFTLSARYPLKTALEQLGMEEVFDTSANLMGIDGLRDLFLSSVLHGSWIALDEQGVTAAAATAATIGIKSVGPKAGAVKMIADHPFLFFIVDLKSQEMLFMGKLVQPG